MLEPTRAGTRLVLTRHGQTDSNRRHALDTLPPGPELTEEGQQQAAALADELAPEPLLAVYASLALRTQQTAAPVAAKHQLDLHVLEGLQEVYVGELEGSSEIDARRRFEEIYAEWHSGRLDVPMPAGETGRQAVERFTRSLGSALPAEPRAGRSDASNLTETGSAAGSVLVVSHGAILRLVAAQLATNVGSELANSAYLPNAGTIILDPDPDGPTGWRCTHWSGHPELDAQN